MPKEKSTLKKVGLFAAVFAGLYIFKKVTDTWVSDEDRERMSKDRQRNGFRNN